MGCGSSAQPIEDTKASAKDPEKPPTDPAPEPAPTEGPESPQSPVPSPSPPNINSPVPGARRKSSGQEHTLLPDDQAFDPAPVPPSGDLGFAVNEEDEFKCIDMDAPRSAKAFVSQPQSPFSTTLTAESKLPVGAQSKRRFRKRSVNLHPLPDNQLATVRQSFDQIDSAGTGFIAPQQLKDLLKANYKPSEVETSQVLEWLDTKGTGHVEFNEYLIGMASVMSNAGIAKEAGIEQAREALSMEMQRMTQMKASHKEGDGEVPTFNLENVAAAHDIVGEANIEKMKERWNSLDTENKGYLDREQIKELIRLTYVPSVATMEAFMRVFTLSEKGIARDDFVQGMTLLHGDFSYVMPHGGQAHSSVRLN